MKRAVFLLSLIMAVLCIGCSTTGSRAGQRFTTSALIATKTPGDLYTDNDQGICLPISTTISVGIDVTGIVDYIQGEPTLAPSVNQTVQLDPWICWIQRF